MIPTESLTIDCFPIDLNDNNSTACLLGIPRYQRSYTNNAEIVCDGNIVEIGTPLYYDDKYQLITGLNELLIKNELDSSLCQSLDEAWELICYFNPNGKKILPECAFTSHSHKLSLF